MFGLFLTDLHPRTWRFQSGVSRAVVKVILGERKPGMDGILALRCYQVQPWAGSCLHSGPVS